MCVREICRSMSTPSLIFATGLVRVLCLVEILLLLTNIAKQNMDKEKQKPAVHVLLKIHHSPKLAVGNQIEINSEFSEMGDGKRIISRVRASAMHYLLL